MARTDPQFNLRMPTELKEKISESATIYGRSINADIVARLEESFADKQETRGIFSVIFEAKNIFGIFDATQAKVLNREITNYLASNPSHKLVNVMPSKQDGYLIGWFEGKSE